MIKASGHAAVMLTTAFFVGVATPSLAAATADNATSASKTDGAASAPMNLNKYTKHRHHYTHHRHSEVAKSSPSKDMGVADNGAPASMPPAVVNANAQLAAADTPADSVDPAQAQESDPSQATESNQQAVQPNANGQVIGSDQLNEVDRASEAASAAPAPAINTEVPTPRAAPVMASTSSSENSSWDEASLIGKIFIGFGTLLTLASAARMFMA